jgi:muramoyltetrapeptide carboxypeptidase
VILPTPLRPGSRVALIAPAGPVTDEKIETALRRCERLGLVPLLGASARARTGYLAGGDTARARDFATALEGADAIWALRGGYGVLRTLAHVDLGPLRDRPVPFIGFSDNTAVHLALLNAGVVSFHGPHAGFEHFPAATETAFQGVLREPRPVGILPLPDGWAPRVVVPGVAEGRLVGGNLALLAASCGTPYQPDTRGAILFFEDVGEALYRVDRMLMQLRLAGLLDRLAGIAIGEFTEMEEAVYGTAAGAVSLESVVREILGPLGVPIVMGLPFGHGEENWTLPVGVAARLDAGAGTLEILEPAVSAGGWSA